MKFYQLIEYCIGYIWKRIRQRKNLQEVKAKVQDLGYNNFASRPHGHTIKSNSKMSDC